MLPERTTVSKWTLPSTLLLPLLFAGCTTVSVDGLNNDACSDYVPPAMWAATPHAAPPGSSQASHGQFEIGEAGQLEKANSDKVGTQHIILTCETKKVEAAKRAAQQLKPWYRKIF